MQTMELRSEWASRMERLLQEDAQRRRQATSVRTHTRWVRVAFGAVALPAAAYGTWLLAMLSGLVA